MLAEPDDDGYVSPDFDLPSDSESEPTPPPTKRAKADPNKSKGGKSRLAEDEELALQLLRGK